MFRVVNRLFANGMAVAATLCASSAFAQLTYNPVATTGFDQDIVIEMGLADGTPGASGEHGSRQFYQQGLSTQIETHKMGLLQNNTGFVSPTTGNTINFNFAPFNGNNILKFDATNQATKTLSLGTPAEYSSLAFIYSGGSLNATGNNPQYQGVVTFTINYVGGATQTGTFKAPDWGTAPAAIEGAETYINAGRINAGATGANPWPLTPDPETTANRWRLMVKEVATTSTANILSVDFGNPQQHANATPEILDPLATATPTGATLPVTGADISVFGFAGAPAGGGGNFNVADFNHLNGVDAADLTALRSKFGLTGTAANADGDADVDMDVDGQDFLIWQRNLGATSIGAVPEPAGAVLVLLGVAGVSQLRRRRR